jgi:hypothetical protein
MLASFPWTREQFRRNGMEALIALFTIVGSWLVLDAFALRYGADSRDTLPDDHQR